MFRPAPQDLVLRGMRYRSAHSDPTFKASGSLYLRGALAARLVAHHVPKAGLVRPLGSADQPVQLALEVSDEAHEQRLFAHAADLANPGEAPEDSLHRLCVERLRENYANYRAMQLSRRHVVFQRRSKPVGAFSFIRDQVLTPALETALVHRFGDDLAWICRGQVCPMPN